MKKYYISIISIISSVLLMMSCSEITSHDDSEIIYYVNIQLEGSDVIYHPVNTDFVDPGYSATDNGEDVSSTVSVGGDAVDATALGLYEISYSATSADGYPASKSRMVIVYDPSTPANTIPGSYSTAIVRTESDGSNPRNYAGAINIVEKAPGIFYVDCLLGATYSVHYGYGSNYAMTGYIALNADNSISLLSSYVKGWGDGLEGFQNGAYDPATGGLYWESIYAGNDTYAVTSTSN